MEGTEGEYSYKNKTTKKNADWILCQKKSFVFRSCSSRIAILPCIKFVVIQKKAYLFLHSWDLHLGTFLFLVSRLRAPYRHPLAFLWLPAPHILFHCQRAVQHPFHGLHFVTLPLSLLPHARLLGLWGGEEGKKERKKRDKDRERDKMVKISLKNGSLSLSLSVSIL